MKQPGFGSGPSSGHSPAKAVPTHNWSSDPLRGFCLIKAWAMFNSSHESKIEGKPSRRWCLERNDKPIGAKLDKKLSSWTSGNIMK